MKTFFCIAALFFTSLASADLGCLEDFRIQQKYVAHTLSSRQLHRLESFAAHAKPSQGWKALGESGDSYAELAHRVVSDDSGLVNAFYRSLIRAHWLNTAGEAGYKTQFKAVAVQHFRQYVAILKTGYWPDSDQILLSYLTAVKDHSLPQTTVFDAVWARSGYDRVVTWQELNHLSPGRTVVDSRICLDGIEPFKAWEIVNLDFLTLPFKKDDFKKFGFDPELMLLHSWVR
jgi:hypothetical protein